MIRILIIDDAETPEFLNTLERDVGGGYNTEVKTAHLNPTQFFKGVDDDAETNNLLIHVGSQASEFWDVALIDINLNEVERPEAERLDLSLSIAEAFRESNRSAILMLYSGTLAKHIPKLIEEDKSPKKSGSEKVLKRIFHSGVAAFVPRDELIQQVYSALEDPPLSLLADRMFTRHSSLLLKCQESEFNGKSFSELCKCIRKQDVSGKRLSKLIVEFGIACIVDLNG